MDICDRIDHTTELFYFNYFIYKRCDNLDQCVDWSDELNCTLGQACADGKYACRTGLNIWQVKFSILCYLK